MKKKIIALAVSVLMVMNFVAAQTFAYPEDEVKVYIDNVQIEFDVKPQILFDRIMVPMRKIFEELGATVEWDNPSQTATGIKDGTVIEITLDTDVMYKNGVPSKLDVYATSMDGRTLVPLRAISEGFGCDVLWVQKSQSVMITTKPDTTENTNTPTTATGTNLFNPKDPNVLIGQYYNTYNILTENPNYNQSGFIPVKPLTDYTASDTARIVVWYDGNYTFLDTTTSADFAAKKFVTAPEGAAYARFMTDTKSWASFRVQEGIALTGDILDNPNKIRGKDFVSYGDSITAQEKWQPYVINEFELKHTNLGVGSSTLAYVAEQEEKYPCMVNADRIQAIKDADPDIITLWGGTNDAHLNVKIGTIAEFSKMRDAKDKTTYIGAYSYLIETLRAWKPNLQIVILTTMQSFYDNNDYKAYADAAMKVAQYYKIPVVDTYSKSGITKETSEEFLADGLHPNDVGGKKIAALVIEKFRQLSKA